MSLKVKHWVWPTLRDEGMVVEEAEDEDDEMDVENEKFDEKQGNIHPPTTVEIVNEKPGAEWVPRSDGLDVR